MTLEAGVSTTRTSPGWGRADRTIGMEGEELFLAAAQAAQRSGMSVFGAELYPTLHERRRHCCTLLPETTP
jgi:hypothetical protein